MADNLGARASSMPIVISDFPSWNWTKGSSKPIPYPVTFNLSMSLEVSPNVFCNGSNAFVLASNTALVEGDKIGKIGGVISGTVSAMAEPIKHSMSVRVNKKWAVRCGDLFNMNNKNTIGTLVCPPPPSKGDITDTGKVPSAQPAPAV